MSTGKKWDDASQKDLIFAMLMSTGDGSGTIKADWQEVEKIMTSWGYSFTASAMSQQWSKKMQKAFKERHPSNAKDGGTKPSTPSKVSGACTPKTPSSSKGKQGKRKRPAPGDDDTSPESGGVFNPNPIAKEKTPRASAKKMKYSEESGVDDDDEEHVVVKGETMDDKDYDHAVQAH